MIQWQLSIVGYVSKVMDGMATKQVKERLDRSASYSLNEIFHRNGYFASFICHRTP